MGRRTRPYSWWFKFFLSRPVTSSYESVTLVLDRIRTCIYNWFSVVTLVVASRKI